jgi:hypothetical protein
MSDCEKTNTLAIVAFILAFLMPIVGLILGIIALVQLNSNPGEKGKGLAIAAIIISIVLPLAVVVFFILSLASFGVLSPNAMLPSRCMLPAGFDCADFAVGANGEDNIKIAVRNGGGWDIAITDLTATPGEGNPMQGTCTASPTGTDALAITNYGVTTITLNCPPGSLASLSKDPGKKYRWTLNFEYYTSIDPESRRTMSGELTASVGP